MKTPAELLRSIESAMFAPQASRRDVESFCEAARKHGFQGVCVNGSRVALACAVLEESEVQVSALVGFPFGAGDADAKRYEAEIAVDQGAQEIDFVINVGRLKEGDGNFVLREMRDIVEAADERPVKAILETHLLTGEEKTMACQLVLDSGVKFVVTATDFHSPAVTVEEIKLLSGILGGQAGVKAAGGIRDLVTAAALLEAGAKRIGTTAGAVLAGGS